MVFMGIKKSLLQAKRMIKRGTDYSQISSLILYTIKPEIERAKEESKKLYNMISGLDGLYVRIGNMKGYIDKNDFKGALVWVDKAIKKIDEIRKLDISIYVKET